ncbi:hypothetical protein PMAYCL1PPCAC_16168, partial [Pristionchus mayeri]
AQVALMLADGAQPASLPASHRSDDVMAEIKERANIENVLVKQADQLVVRFLIMGANGQTKNWLVDLKSVPPFVGHNDSAYAELDVSLSDDTFMEMAAGKITPWQAFTTGQVKVSGRMGRAMLLETILNPSMLKMKL